MIGKIVAGMSRLTGLVNVHGHHIYKGSITNESLVVDLGAHKGAFSHEMAARFGCTCIMAEASPDLFDSLEVPNALSSKHHVCIARNNEPVLFHISGYAEASSVYKETGIIKTIRLPGCTFNDFVREHIGEMPIDLLKVDIEGAEIDLFETASPAILRNILQITCEFHDFIDPEPVISRTIASVEKAGFIALVISAPFNSDILFVNRRLVTREPRLRMMLPMLRQVIKHSKLKR